MAFYTICGKPECKHFAHATYVSQYLYEHLPNFKYKKIEKSKADWPSFVTQLNKKNGWYMVKSPIIWKEISTWGGKPYLIGGLAEFWEYCYCYYGLESSISNDELEKLARDNLSFFTEETNKHLKEHQNYHSVITILGADQINFIEHLLEELFKIPYFISDTGCFIKIYQEDLENPDLEKEKRGLSSIAEYFNSQGIFGGRPVVKIMKSEDKAIANSDLLIFMEDFSRNEEESYEIWMKRCLTRIMMLADVININAKRELRVIFCNEGPMCLMATCMIEYCTVLIPYNIVALTADRGVSVISTISELTGVPVSKISAPPVWGFIGMSEYVDESNIIFKGHIYKPYKRVGTELSKMPFMVHITLKIIVDTMNDLNFYKRNLRNNLKFTKQPFLDISERSVPTKLIKALTASEGSTLPLGTVIPELRVMSYLLPHQHDEISTIVNERKKIIMAKLHRKPFLAKLRALKSLLELWYAEHPSDQIISLGVCANGSYGIPPALVFSQPSIQDQKRRWKPFPKYPLINESTSSKVQDFIDDSVLIVQSIGLEVNNYCSSSESENTI